MNNLEMFCLTLEPDHYDFITGLGYQPVGLGNQNFNKNWFTDKNDINISKKNKNYGEYTFHYWIWKNYLNKIENNWIGFCQYRKFWTIKKIETENIDFNTLKESVLNKIPDKYDNFESIIGEPFYVNQFRFSKFIKRNLKTMISNPSLLFNKNKRTLKFHFDMWHGHGNLDKAINLLDNEDRNDFEYYMNSNVSFNPHNMFVCKTKDKLKEYYEVVFPWLERCEKEFGFENLKGYGLQRIYGFLAERFMSYWFKKNTKFMTLPIYFKDIGDF